ncbi:ANTAR domain-containing protein [Streptomyces sp. NPDC005840]|jgi:hypothetical protein|uniref:ANTAR domain-containing protein n=1 Tax=Streptomyces sp. NPDC005840 TaxID=3157072 RepID=UPI0033F54568
MTAEDPDDLTEGCGRTPSVQEGAAAEAARMAEEIRQLREAVASHAAVDQAIGVLVALAHIDPTRGFGMLREVSQRSNTKLRNVAEQIVEWPSTGHLTDPVRRALLDALAAAGRTWTP